MRSDIFVVTALAHDAAAAAGGRALFVNALDKRAVE
jgi:hypothetical protein